MFPVFTSKPVLWRYSGRGPCVNNICMNNWMSLSHSWLSVFSSVDYAIHRTQWIIAKLVCVILRCASHSMNYRETRVCNIALCIALNELSRDSCVQYCAVHRTQWIIARLVCAILRCTPHSMNYRETGVCNSALYIALCGLFRLVTATKDDTLPKYLNNGFLHLRH